MKKILLTSLLILGLTLSSKADGLIFHYWDGTTEEIFNYPDGLIQDSTDCKLIVKLVVRLSINGSFTAEKISCHKSNKDLIYTVNNAELTQITTDVILGK